MEIRNSIFSYDKKKMSMSYRTNGLAGDVVALSTDGVGGDGAPGEITRAAGVGHTS